MSSDVKNTVKCLIDRSAELGLQIRTYKNITIIDAGVNTEPAPEVGLKLIEIATGGYAKVNIITKDIDSNFNVNILRINVTKPITACMCYQMASWIVKKEYATMYISGPGKTIVKKPRKLIEKFCKECELEPIFLIETDVIPREDFLEELHLQCRDFDNVIVLLTSPRSYVGQLQICGRVVEVALFSLYARKVELSDTMVISCYGEVLIPPKKVEDPLTAVAICNDFILLTGSVTMNIDKDELSIPSDTVYMEGDKLFTEVLHRYGIDFLSKIDEKMFKVAQIIVKCRHKTYTIGKLWYDKAIKIISRV